MFRRVKMLGDRARKQADEMGLKEGDIVFVDTKIENGTPPVYTLTHITDSPTQYLKDRFLNGGITEPFGDCDCQACEEMREGKC